jgi:hypothetical protein
MKANIKKELVNVRDYFNLSNRGANKLPISLKLGLAVIIAIGLFNA